MGERSKIELALAAGGGDVLDGLSEAALREVLYDWSLWQRPSQAIPEGMGDKYRIWFIRAGRGFGKTRTGAETARIMAKRVSRMALVGPTAADIRDVMVEGESGIMSVCPKEERPTPHYGRRSLVFPNGCTAYLYTAQEPERLRGPQHEWAWVDEPASLWRGPDVLSNLLLGLRLGSAPWALLTGTPKPLTWLRAYAERHDTVSTRGSTFDNLTNLAPTFIEDIKDRYGGTMLGAQELYAEWVEPAGGVFQREWFPIVDTPLEGKRVRAWDFAASTPTEGNPDPDWTAGALCVWNPDVEVNGRKGVLQVQHVARWRMGPGDTIDRFARTCAEDRLHRVLVEEEGGSAGKAMSLQLRRAVPNMRVDAVRPTGSKQTRAELWAGLAQQGRVQLLAGDWNVAFLDEVTEFPAGGHDDQVDAVSLAAAWLTGRGTGKRPRQPTGRLPVTTGPRVGLG